MIRILVTLLGATFLLGGCSIIPPLPNDPNYAPVHPSAHQPYPVVTGSIYNVNHGFFLYEDVTARRVGDILTVVFDEQTNASKSAESSIEKDTTVAMPNPTTLGSVPTFNAPGFIPLASNKDNTLEFTVKNERDFEGKADSDQSNQLSGTISVVVSQVLPNGNLVVRGEKWIGLNQGKEYIRLSGIVRPSDVTARNEVLSSRVADSRITYSGVGQLADANKAGWLLRAISSAFWPF